MFSEQEQIPHPPTPLTSGSRERFKSERAPYSSEPIISISAKYPLSTLQIAPQQQSRRIPRTHGPLQRQHLLSRFYLSIPTADWRQLLLEEGFPLIRARLSMTLPVALCRLTISTSARCRLIRTPELLPGLICRLRPMQQEQSIHTLPKWTALQFSQFMALPPAPEA